QSSVFNLPGCASRFEFVFGSEVQQAECYAANYTELRRLLATSESFRASFNAFSHVFLERKPVRQENRVKHLLMSHEYLLEELAIISCLAANAPTTFIYPGSLTILDEIGRGEHPDVPSGLRAMNYVELKIKRRRTS